MGSLGAQKLHFFFAPAAQPTKRYDQAFSYPVTLHSLHCLHVYSRSVGYTYRYHIGYTRCYVGYIYICYAGTPPTSITIFFHLSHWEQTATEEVDQERERRLTSDHAVVQSWMGIKKAGIDGACTVS